MTQNNQVTDAPKLGSAIKPMLIGAAIGLLLISMFVFGVDNPKPEWGKFWQIRPLVITPMAGAMGGLFFYLMTWASARGSINKWVAFLLGFVVFIVGLWMGVVLGLAGTMWD